MKEQEEVVKVFEKSLTSSSTPLEAITDFVMKPVPADVGTIQLYVLRNESGMNRFAPKYTLFLEKTGHQIMMA